MLHSSPGHVAPETASRSITAREMNWRHSMQVLVSTEQRYSRTPDGIIWSDGLHAYPFWQRYLEVFDGVRVLARVQDTESVPDNWLPAAGDSVTFVAVPYYIGPAQYLLKNRAVRRAIAGSVGESDAIIIRVGGSPIAACLEPHMRARRGPYAVAVIGDPFDGFS